jgi:hypothetical protein
MALLLVVLPIYGNDSVIVIVALSSCVPLLLAESATPHVLLLPTGGLEGRDVRRRKRRWWHLRQCCSSIAMQWKGRRSK